MQGLSGCCRNAFPRCRAASPQLGPRRTQDSLLARTCGAVGEEREAGANGDGSVGVTADAVQSALQAGGTFGSRPRAVDLVGLPVLGNSETRLSERTTLVKVFRPTEHGNGMG
jgi:hypothetical protein